MTIQQIYDLAINLGIEKDPREKAGVEKHLKRVKKEYEELPPKKKEYFDKESLTNPYSDTRVLFGDPSINVDKILTGIDIEVGEMVLAERLNEKGEGIDLILAHHPEGISMAGLHEVLDLQVEYLVQYGVPVHIAEGLTRERTFEVRRRFNPINHSRSVDAARILNLPFMSVHTPADNLAYQFLKKMIEEKKPETVDEVLEMLMEIGEYKEAAKGKAGPQLFAGNEKNRAGKVVPAEVTGGTEGAKELYERLSKAGVSTIIATHASEEHKKEAEKHHINLVVAGHISTDSLGMNLFQDKLEDQGITIMPCSGLIRVRRTTPQK